MFWSQIVQDDNSELKKHRFRVKTHKTKDENSHYFQYIRGQIENRPLELGLRGPQMTFSGLLMH